MSQEDQGFTVKDRRIFAEDGAERRSEAQGPGEQEASVNEDQAPPEPDERQEQADAGARHLPPVDFGAFIFSLSHAAMTHLGHIPDPATGEAAADSELARHTIDTIAMLKEKTQGNLSQDEQRLIDHALTELRLAYVRQHG
jgi:hypothetical protein